MKKSKSDEFQPAKLTKPRPARSRSRRKVDASSEPPTNDEFAAPAEEAVSHTIIQTNFTKDTRRKAPSRNLSSDNLSSSMNSESGSCIAASVVFADYDTELLDEIDQLNPHEHEGGDLVDASTRSAPEVLFRSGGSRSAAMSSSITASGRSGMTSSHFSSCFASTASGSAGHYVPTDYETLMKSTNDGTLADIMAGIEERYYSGDKTKLSNILENSLKSSGSSALYDEEILSRVRTSLNGRESVVGGKDISQMSLEEQRELLGRSSNSVFEDEDAHEIKILASIDWASLTKSCKCAKNAFRDSDYSGQVVVKNMFLKNLCALSAQLNVYTQANDHDNAERIASLTTDTKRALRFGLSCLSPPRSTAEQSTILSSITHASKPVLGSDFRDDVERYRSGRRFRQELQDAAVKSEASEEEHNRLGLHLPLVDIILGTRPQSHTSSQSVEKDQYTIQVLAARMLCNLVTDNPVAAEIVLMDMPFGPNNEETERRMSMPFSGDPLKNNTDIVLCWSDLVAATAKLGSSVDPEREALAAVAAALHNILASLETRDSLLELDNELKRREQLKGRRARAIRARRSTSFACNSDDDSSSAKPTDAGFDAVYNRQLMNALLRNILPAHAVLMESRSVSSSVGEKGRPKFHAAMSSNDHSHSFGDTSDSATEWISLVLERMASRGLLPQMFQSAGGPRGRSVTPEQVVLTSCIRQAVDDYHSARTPSGETGEFGRRRLSIAAKSAGVTTLSRPHPLWGRVREEFGGEGGAKGAAKNSSNRPRSESSSNCSVVPVLLFLANEEERLYLHSKSLMSNPTELLYDGELSCTIRVIDDVRDIIAQCLSRHNVNPTEKNKQCVLPEARSIIGTETRIINDCLFDLAKLLDSALAKNSGKNARDLYLTPQEQHSAIVMVRLLGNIVYQCRYNQDLLRIIQVPLTNPSHGNNSEKRIGLHVILSTTSLAPTCLSLREWCIVAIRNAVEDNDANAEAVRTLEAQNTLGDTPELRRMGMKVNLDAKGKVHVQKRDAFN